MINAVSSRKLLEFDFRAVRRLAEPLDRLFALGRQKTKPDRGPTAQLRAHRASSPNWERIFCVSSRAASSSAGNISVATAFDFHSSRSRADAAALASSSMTRRSASATRA
jgi:hypothetical protein